MRRRFPSSPRATKSSTRTSAAGAMRSMRTEVRLVADRLQQVFEQAMQQLADRRATAPPKVDQSTLPAGREMTFYCRTCGHVCDVKPELYLFPANGQCSECRGFHEWLVTMRDQIPALTDKQVDTFLREYELRNETLEEREARGRRILERYIAHLPTSFELSEDPRLYDAARDACHAVGLPWTDPRTGIT